MTHFHVMVVERGEKSGRQELRKGALTLTEDAARNEAGIELATQDRKATIERCHRDCFGSSLA